jgi:hypothetical protein
LGNWIPEVARNMATINLRASRPSLGTLSLQGRLSGRQFDDDANAYLLHSYFRLDAYGSHDFGKRFELFAAGENLLNRQIEVAKTPTTTLATPRIARAGFLIRLGRAGNYREPRGSIKSQRFSLGTDSQPGVLQLWCKMCASSPLFR